MMRSVIVFTVFLACSLAQRSPYAGKRPIGYPELETTTADPLANRFGEDGTTEKLPIEALGDRDLVKRISKLPIDQQPFWYINWKAFEEHRKNPQTYPQKQTPFIETNSPPQGSIGQGTFLQQGFPQRFPQRSNAQAMGSQSNQKNLPNTESRFGGLSSKQNESNAHLIYTQNPKNQPNQNVNHGDIDHIQGIRNINNRTDAISKNDPNSNKGNNDSILTVPRKDTKTNINMSESDGKKAVQDFSKYFLARH